MGADAEAQVETVASACNADAARRRRLNLRHQTLRLLVNTEVAQESAFCTEAVAEHSQPKSIRDLALSHRLWHCH